MSEDDTGDESDDWFESALSEDDGADGPDGPVAGGRDGRDERRRSDTGERTRDDAADQTRHGADGHTRDGAGEHSGDGGGEHTGGSADAGNSSGDATDAENPFGGATDAENPFGDTGVSNDDSFGDWGEASAGDAGAAGDGNMFDDSFETAMGGVSTSGAGDAGGDDFDDDAVESDIPRLDVGIAGLDNMIQGGVPRRHLAVVIGGAGTGKTTFGLQFLRHGLTREEPEKSVFITLEQTYDDIMATARERGWEFERHEDEGNLAVVDLDPVEMANSLDNIRSELPELIEEFDADRFVLDSVSLLEMMYDEQATRRTEIFDFTQSLKEAGVTTVFTSEAAESNPYASRHGIIEYLTDAVFLLRYVRSETQETRLAVEIQKIRNANHSRETKPYEITLDGISVYEQANIF